MRISANDIRVGQILVHEGKLWQVLKNQHVQPGKGGAYMQVEMKDIKAGTKLNIRFRSAETIEKAHLEQKDYQYLYDGGDTVELMDQTTFEQVTLNKTLIGDKLAYLQEGMIVTVEFYGEEPIAIALPETIVLGVTECEPVVKGQTAASSYKPALLENGVRIMVPPFISQGDKVVVRTSDGTYMERAK